MTSPLNGGSSRRSAPGPISIVIPTGTSWPGLSRGGSFSVNRVRQSFGSSRDSRMSFNWAGSLRGLPTMNHDEKSVPPVYGTYAMFDWTTLLWVFTSLAAVIVARRQKWSTTSPVASGGMYHLIPADAGGLFWADSGNVWAPAASVPMFSVCCSPFLSVTGSHVVEPVPAFAYSNQTTTLVAA